MSKLRLECKPFHALNVNELYDIMVLRQEVFVVEQNCVFLDADGKDKNALHCLAFNENNQLLAYTRIFNKDVYYQNYSSVGRVVSSPLERGQNFGRIIFQYSLDQIEIHFEKTDVKIGAQSYLEKFYGSFGFQSIGEDYIEDGIPHKIMVKNNEDL